MWLQHYYLYYGNGTEPLVNLGIHGFVACMFAVGLAIGVFIAVGALFVIQVSYNKLHFKIKSVIG